jgi:two-component system chemotaxis response regulator CheY
MASRSPLRGASALIMDDNAQIVGLVRQILETAGVRFIGEAISGDLGLEALRERDYDFVIADWNMPGMTGLEFLKRVRDPAKSPKHDIPVLMLTANATLHDVREAQAAGINGYVAKPFTPSLLIRRVEAAIT